VQNVTRLENLFDIICRNLLKRIWLKPHVTHDLEQGATHGALGVAGGIEPLIQASRVELVLTCSTLHAGKGPRRICHGVADRTLLHTLHMVMVL
jgi:hypothetical protein